MRSYCCVTTSRRQLSPILLARPKKILCSFYNIAEIVATASGGPAGKRAPKHVPRKKVPTKKAGGCSKIQQPSACKSHGLSKCLAGSSYPQATRVNIDLLGIKGNFVYHHICTELITEVCIDNTPIGMMAFVAFMRVPIRFWDSSKSGFIVTRYSCATVFANHKSFPFGTLVKDD